MSHTYTITEILSAREMAARLQLQGCGPFCTLPALEVQDICNGIGAEWMPASARALLDKRHPTIRIAAMIHDVHYFLGTGTDEDFKAANHNFYVNGCALAKYEYGWWNPTRYLVMWDAYKLANICEAFGRAAYDQAIEDRKSKETT